MLAASSPMRAPLARVAAAVASSDAVAWWAAPLERATQAEVAFPPPDARVAPSHPTTAGEALGRWRADALAEEATARRERPTDPRAPMSGAWWSTPPRALPRTTRTLPVAGPVGLWLVEDSFGWDAATVRRVNLPPGADVLEIDGPDAWAALCRRHPLEMTAARRHDWFRTTGVDARWVVPDWSRVAAEHDAVHLTVTGYLTTAGRAIPVDDATSTVLAGWDPDVTWWLTDAAPTPGDAQSWRRHDDVWRAVAM